LSKAARHLRQFEEAGIISDYAGRIDKKVLGFGGTTLVSVQLDKQIDKGLPISRVSVWSDCPPQDDGDGECPQSVVDTMMRDGAADEVVLLEGIERTWRPLAAG
jgi:hypothetical protein